MFVLFPTLTQHTARWNLLKATEHIHEEINEW